MRKPLLAALILALVAGAFSALGANNTYSVPGKWFGLITDTKDLRLGSGVTADQVRTSVAGGAKYALVNAFFAQRYILLEPADKVASFAGQTAFVSGNITTHSMLKTNNFLADSDGGGGGNNNFTIAVSQIEPHAESPYYIAPPDRGAGQP